MQSKSYIDIFKDSFPDANKLTDIQRKNLLLLLHNALVELRILGFHGKSQQASDLADAFHNLPLWLDLKVFSFEHFRTYLEPYCRKYSQDSYNYLELLERISRNEDL